MKQIIAVATVAAALAIAASPVSAQTATTTDSTATATTDATATSTTAVKTPVTTSTPQMVSEALQRSQKRHEKFLADGTPERWGSEEPFVFDPTKAAVQ